MAPQVNNSALLGSLSLFLKFVQVNGVRFGKLARVVDYEINQRRCHSDLAVVGVLLSGVQVGDETADRAFIKIAVAGCLQVGNQRGVEILDALPSLHPILHRKECDGASGGSAKDDDAKDDDGDDAAVLQQRCRRLCCGGLLARARCFLQMRNDLSQRVPDHAPAPNQLPGVQAQLNVGRDEEVDSLDRR